MSVDWTAPRAPLLDEASEPRRWLLSRHGRVASFFLFGWVLGLVTLLAIPHACHVPRWVLVSGWGYVLAMLGPVGVGTVVTLSIVALERRAWGAVGTGFVLLGLATCVAGLFLFGR